MSEEYRHINEGPSDILIQAVKELKEDWKLLPIIVALSGGPRSLKYLSQKLGYKVPLAAQLKRLIKLGLVVQNTQRQYVLLGICPELVAKAAILIGERRPREERVTIQTPVPEPEIKAAVHPKLVDNVPLEKPNLAAINRVSMNAVAQKFKVPERRQEGEAVLGAVQLCVVCKEKPTPLKYGTTPVCYTCARKG